MDWDKCCPADVRGSTLPAADSLLLVTFVTDVLKLHFFSAQFRRQRACNSSYLIAVSHLRWTQALSSNIVQNLSRTKVVQRITYTEYGTVFIDDEITQRIGNPFYALGRHVYLKFRRFVVKNTEVECLPQCISWTDLKFRGRRHLHHPDGVTRASLLVTNQMSPR